MNINVDCRIKAPNGSELDSGIQTSIEEERSRLKNALTGHSFEFRELFGSSASLETVYDSTLKPSVQFFLHGFNTCLILLGEANAGKSFVLRGNSTSRGFLSLALDQILNEIGEDGLQHNSVADLRLQAFEVTDDTILDLLAPNGEQRIKNLKIDYDADQSYFISQLKSFAITKSQYVSIQDSLDEAISARSPSAVTFIQFNLSRIPQANLSPTVSQLTLVIIPVLESHAVSTPGVRIDDPSGRRNPALSRKSLASFKKLVSNLSIESKPNRVVQYNSTNLTRLLTNELGGNCKTDVLCCVRSNANPYILNDILDLANSLSKIENYPIPNDDCAIKLLTQYRAHIIALKRRLEATEAGTAGGFIESSNPDLLHKVQTENVMLRDVYERLQNKLEQFETRYGVMAMSQTDLNDQLLNIDQERLQMSKSLVDAQLENNRLKEEHEADMFTLSNEILTLKQMLKDVELERDREIEESTKLRADVINMVEMLKEDGYKLPSNQVQGIVYRATGGRHGTNTDGTLNRDVASTGRQFQGDVNYQEELIELKRTSEDKIRQLNSQIEELQVMLGEQKKKTREYQRNYSESTAQLITLHSEKSQLEVEYNRAQHRLKSLSENLNQRLSRYIKDIAKHVDHGNSKMRTDAHGGDIGSLRRYTDDMLGDLRTVHKTREEQLSSAAQSYKQRMADVVRRHEELMIAYCDLRNQVKVSGLVGSIDIGPEVRNFNLTEDELATRQQREINRLQTELSKSQTKVEALKLRTRMNKHLSEGPSHSRSVKADESWNTLQKQLKQFTHNTQQELEQERAKLLSENAMLKQDVAVLQEYIDSHLNRFKQEIDGMKSSGYGTNGGTRIRATGPHTDNFSRKPVAPRRDIVHV